MSVRFDPALIPHEPNLSLEDALWANHIDLVAGLDEAGRGAWAGPVAAAVVVFPAHYLQVSELSAVRDSKQLSPRQRSELSPLVKASALDWGVGFSSALEIDGMGILPATRLAMTRALENLAIAPDHLLIDALFLPEQPIPQTALIKGDQRSLSIAAASILAKTTRDEWMVNYASEVPGYHFAQNKGYGTRAHQSALALIGPCPQHRRSYKPIKLSYELKPDAD